MSAEMTPAKAKALREPFPAAAIGKLPKGGVMLDYVGHAATTDRLLAVDPEWSWEPLAVDANGLPAFDSARNLWIRLTICGVTRIGVGDGKSAKECIGDAIRNAAMRFGVALDLWAKEDLAEIQTAGERTDGAVPEPAPPPRPPVAPETSKPMAAKTRGLLFALFSQKGVAEEQQLAGANQILGTAYESRSQFTEADARRLIDVLKTRPDVDVPMEASE